MRVLIAPDSFKGSLNALEVAKAIAKGVKNVDKDIETVLVPMADGGEGTVQSLIDATGGRIVDLEVHDPLNRKIKSFYGIMGNGTTAVIEMASASGLPLLNATERNPLKTTTFGTGELIKDALDNGCTEIILGLGGSATNDGGVGMARALGVKFYDSNKLEIGYGGGELSKICSIDISGIDNRISNVKFTVACDVDNPLCGASGASHVYGKQKGANEFDVESLDKGLDSFSLLIKKELSIDLKDFPGAGAAGGLGYGVMVFLNGTLHSGIEIVSKATKLADKIKGSDLVITGEGQIDWQTAFGKTPFGVCQLAKLENIPVVAIAGSLGKDYKTLYNKGFDSIYSLIDKPMSLDIAMENTAELLENTAEAVMRLFVCSKMISNNKNKQ